MLRDPSTEFNAASPTRAGDSSAGSSSLSSVRQDFQLAAESKTKLLPKAPGNGKQIYPVSASGAGPARTAVKVDVPGAPALHNALSLARSLRPFGRRFPSIQFSDLDEGATADLSARQRRLSPVFRKLRERWFDLILVVEDTPSMTVWKKTLQEFELMVASHGAFRDVRRVRLVMDNSGHLSIFEASGRSIHPRSLIEPDGRRLVLIFTHGAARAWNSAPLVNTVLAWSAKQSVAIVSMLPKSQWEQTALGEPDVKIRSLRPGLPNSSYIENRPAFHRLINSGGHAVPVLSLEVADLQRWSNMVMSQGSTAIDAIHFSASTENTTEPPLVTSDAATLSPEARIARFCANASPAAVRLVTALAGSPMNLPIMRLVQQTIFPPGEIHQVHLAEVLLSGLVERVHHDDDPETDSFDFLPGVRLALAQSFDLTDRLNIRRRVFEYIQQHPESTRHFPALIPNRTGTHLLPTWAEPFAEEDEDLLVRAVLSQPRTLSPLQREFAKLFYLLQTPARNLVALVDVAGSVRAQSLLPRAQVAPRKRVSVAGMGTSQKSPQMVFAALGSILAGPLGGALGSVLVGMFGEIFGQSAAKLVTFFAEKQGQATAQKLPGSDLDSFAVRHGENSRTLERAYREALRESLTAIRTEVGTQYEDWFDNWDACLKSSAPLNLDSLPVQPAQYGLDAVFSKTMQRLDALGNSLLVKSLLLEERPVPADLLEQIKARLPELFKASFRALIAKDEYRQAWGEGQLALSDYLNLSIAHIAETSESVHRKLDEELHPENATSEPKLSISSIDPFATVPPLPPSFFPRPELSEPLIESLLSKASTASLTAIGGMGGIGKTIVANAVCHDPRVRQAFPDGILWFAIGKQSELSPESLIQQMAYALNQRFDAYTPATYRSLLKDKAVLVVLDDVWTVETVEPFLLDQNRSRLLYTSRDKSLAAALGGMEYEVGLLTEAEARRFLSQCSGRDPASMPEPYASAILAECKGLVLGLAMIGAALRSQPDRNWSRMAADLKNARVDKIGVRPVGYVYQTLHASIAASVDSLEVADRARYLKLAVLPEDMAAPPGLLQSIWGGEKVEVDGAIQLFVDRSLAIRDAEGNLRLHDFQSDYVRWVYPDPDALKLIESAVIQSLHVTQQHPEQFTSQLIGRLLAYENQTGVAAFLKNLDARTILPRLQPLRVMTGDSGVLDVQRVAIWAVAMSADGRRAVSASEDSFVLIWDLSGKESPRVLKGHSGTVNAVALSADGSRAVSGSNDKTLRVWDLSGKHPPRVLKGHSGTVNAVALSADGSRAVSGSNDYTLRVWTLLEDRREPLLRVLKGHSRRVNAVALTADGSHAVSGSNDYTVRVWDLSGKQPQRVLTGHSGAVNAVALSADGSRAVSGSNDYTVRVWDLLSDQPHGVLEGHTERVNAVALSADGSRALSGSNDKTLRVWDLTTLRCLSVRSTEAGVLACSYEAGFVVVSDANGRLSLFSWEE